MHFKYMKINAQINEDSGYSKHQQTECPLHVTCLDGNVLMETLRLQAFIINVHQGREMFLTCSAKSLASSGLSVSSECSF